MERVYNLLKGSPYWFIIIDTDIEDERLTAKSHFEL